MLLYFFAIISGIGFQRLHSRNTGEHQHGRHTAFEAADNVRIHSVPHHDRLRGMTAQMTQTRAHHQRIRLAAVVRLFARRHLDRHDQRTASGRENPAAILNSVDCQKGDVVTLNYEAPGDATELVAACVSSKGVYYIKVFNVGESNLSFASTTNARTRGTDDEYPTLIELGDYIPSFNAERALASEKSGFNKVLVKDNTNGGNNRYYDVWADGSWKNDRLWSHKTVKGGNWNVESGFIYRSVSNSGDRNTLKSIITTYLKKTGGENTTGTTNKRNNWQDIATGNA